MNKQVNRLIVFRAAKQYMERHHRAPSGPELAGTTGLSQVVCWQHMSALDGADGLPMQFDFTAGHREGEGLSDPFRLNSQRDPWNAPVDLLFA